MSHVMNHPLLTFAALPILGATLGAIWELARGAKA